MKKIFLLGLIGLVVLAGNVAKGQNPVVYSTGFEVGEDTAWTLVGGPNRWHIGSAVADSGSRSLYISNDGGATNAYTNTNVTCAWAYKDLTLSVLGNVVHRNADGFSFGEKGDVGPIVLGTMGSFIKVDGKLLAILPKTCPKGGSACRSSVCTMY